MPAPLELTELRQARLRFRSQPGGDGRERIVCGALVDDLVTILLQKFGPAPMHILVERGRLKGQRHVNLRNETAPPFAEITKLGVQRAQVSLYYPWCNH